MALSASCVLENRLHFCGFEAFNPASMVAVLCFLFNVCMYHVTALLFQIDDACFVFLWQSCLQSTHFKEGTVLINSCMCIKNPLLGKFGGGSFTSSCKMLHTHSLRSIKKEVSCQNHVIDISVHELLRHMTIPLAVDSDVSHGSQTESSPRDGWVF